MKHGAWNMGPYLFTVRTLRMASQSATHQKVIVIVCAQLGRWGAGGRGRSGAETHTSALMSVINLEFVLLLEFRDTLSSKSEQLPIASYIYFHIKLTFYQHAQIFKRLCRNKLVSLLVFFFLKFSVVACHSGKIRRHSHRVFCSKMKKSKNKWNYVGSLGMNKINIIQT